MNNGKIYVLIDPFTNKERYVGFTRVRLESRFSQHKHNALKKQLLTHSYNWFRDCYSKGKLPVCKLLEENIKIEDWKSRESYWITQFPNLTNQKNGGTGVHLNTNSAGRKRSIDAHKISIVQLDQKSQKIKIWDSVMEASLSLAGKHTGNIARAIKLGTLAYDFLWVTLENYNAGIIPKRAGKHWKPVFVLDIQTNTVEQFITGTECSKSLKCSSSTITEAIRLKRLVRKRYRIGISEDIVRSFGETQR